MLITTFRIILPNVMFLMLDNENQVLNILSSKDSADKRVEYSLWRKLAAYLSIYVGLVSMAVGLYDVFE